MRKNEKEILDMVTPSKKVIIIGGGISGLAAAYRLSKIAREKNLPLEITLVEAKAELGGVIETWSRDGFLMEGGPDSFISEKPAAYELVKRLGIDHEVIGTQKKYRRSFIYKKGKLISVPEGFYLIAPTQIKTFLQSPLLSWKTKIRMGCERFIPRRSEFGDESVGSFVRRRLGKEVLERIAQPMIGGIYTADPEHLSLEATFPQFLELERKYGSVIKGLFARKKMKQNKATETASGPRYSLFLSLNGGLKKLAQTLVAHMPEVHFALSAPVRSIELSEGWKVTLQSEDFLRADAVCLALPAQSSASILDTLAPQLAGDLRRIRYESVATVNIAYRREDVPHPLDGFGFVVPAVEKRKLVACSFSSVKFMGRAPHGTVLLRAFVGGALHREMYELDNDAMTRMLREELHHYLGITKPPLFISIQRYPNSMPQYHVGHLELVCEIESKIQSFPGLYLAGNAFRGMGIPDCIRQAEGTAMSIANFLERVKYSDEPALALDDRHREFHSGNFSIGVL